MINRFLFSDISKISVCIVRHIRCSMYLLTFCSHYVHCEKLVFHVANPVLTWNQHAYPNDYLIHPERDRKG